MTTVPGPFQNVDADVPVGLFGTGYVLALWLGKHVVAHLRSGTAAWLEEPQAIAEICFALAVVDVEASRVSCEAYVN